MRTGNELEKVRMMSAFLEFGKVKLGLDNPFPEVRQSLAETLVELNKNEDAGFLIGIILDGRKIGEFLAKNPNFPNH